MVQFQHLKAADRKNNLSVVMREDNSNELVRRIMQTCRVCFVDEKRYVQQCSSSKKLVMLLGYSKAFDEFKKHLGLNIRLNKYDVK